MKRTLLGLTLSVLILTTASCTTTMGDRLADGLKEIITSPVQMRDNVREETAKAEFIPFGAAGGSLKGGFYMGKQIVNGIMTMLTFFDTR